MVFSSEKKELWRYASRNNANCSAGAGNNRQQQLHRHQHLHRLQSPPPDYYATTKTKTKATAIVPIPIPETTPTIIKTRLTDDNRLMNQTHNHQRERERERQRQLEEQNMPPPPYSSVPCGIDCSDTCQRRRMSSSSSSSNCGIFNGIAVGYIGESMEFGGGSVDRYSIGGMSYLDGKLSSTCASASSRSISSFSDSNTTTTITTNKNSDNTNMERNEQYDCYYHNNNNNNKQKKSCKIYNLHENNDKGKNVAVCDQLSNKMTSITNTLSSVPAPTTTTTTIAAATATTMRTSATTSIPIVTSTANVLAATAASIFRNCCGGGGAGGEGGATTAATGDGQIRERGDNLTESSLTTIMCNKYCYNNNNNKQAIMLGKMSARFSQRQYFDAFMKQLKEGQVTVLLKAVKSRQDLDVLPLTALQQQRHNQQYQEYHHQYQQQAHSLSQQQLHCNTIHCCILVHRALILNEEPHVIVCRLFLWHDLKDGSELKRLPDCPNKCDPVYVCCNPLHWCRIVKAETPPPPYELRSPASSKMQLEDSFSEKSFRNGRNQNMNMNMLENNVPTRQLNLLSDQQNIMQNVDLCVRFPESVATAGEDAKACSLIWCQLAYWELRERIGPLYKVKKSSINVYAENPQNDALSEGMCLKDLCDTTTNTKTDLVPPDVQYTRNKIGLGVTLSQEADGVWLYNRSRVPIFLHSPTLTESWFRVCKIVPGECVKAFDTNRINSLYPMSYDDTQMTRVDLFSMRLSFAKGWGLDYKRQDITRCPCWLEVFFKHR